MYIKKILCFTLPLTPSVSTKTILKTFGALYNEVRGNFIDMHQPKPFKLKNLKKKKSENKQKEN